MHMLIIRDTMINASHIKFIKVVENVILIEYANTSMGGTITEKFVYDTSDEADKAFYDITQVFNT